jgi:signal transduction histidine kinase
MTTSTELVNPSPHGWSFIPQPSSTIPQPSSTSKQRSSLVSHVLAPQVWQTWVAPSQVGNNPSLRNDPVTYARFDSPHKSIPEPWVLTHWVEDVGWHRPLTAIKTREQFLGQTAEGRANLSPPMELQIPSLVASSQASEKVQPLSTQAKSRLTQLLAEVAHDIRSPIAVAQQILHSLSQRVTAGERLDDAECELLNQANLRLTQAHQWTEGILLERSLEHGQPVNVRRRFYPAQWRLGIEPLLQSLAMQRRVQLQWNGWDRSLPRLYIDPTHLSRIVLNLVTNALQASPPNSCVKLHVAWLTHITQHLVLTIEDQGSGLPAHRLAQVNASAMWPKDSNEPLGDGLGLRTAKILARGLGGTLVAQASHSGGTQFTLSLPVDNYHSLIRGWLRQNAELAQAEQRVQPQAITIHAVRFSTGAAVEDGTDAANELLAQIDSRFQQTADVSDLVYRVAQDRWLWLSLAPQAKSRKGSKTDRSPNVATPPPALEESLDWIRRFAQTPEESIACRYQQVVRIEGVSLLNCLGSHSSQHNLLSLTAELAEKFAELIGDHIPPVDELTSAQWLGITRPKIGGSARQTRIDSAQRLAPPTVAGGPRVGATFADTPCDKFSGTLAELSQQWHIHQRQLERAHHMLSPPIVATAVLSPEELIN